MPQPAAIEFNPDFQIPLALPFADRLNLKTGAVRMSTDYGKTATRPVLSANGERDDGAAVTCKIVFPQGFNFVVPVVALLELCKACCGEELGRFVNGMEG